MDIGGENRNSADSVAALILENYGLSCNSGIPVPPQGKRMPERGALIKIIKGIRELIFPGYFGTEPFRQEDMGEFVSRRICELYGALYEQVGLAFSCSDCDSGAAEHVCKEFFSKLPCIHRLLLKDAQAGFEGDPAAKSKVDVIFSYPGFFAIFVYRLAHELYVLGVPLIPRIMTEYAHSRTGIDINSGAVIGEYFFIDHGTGVVIGETTRIGDRVKLYQGVTLGALSTKSGQQLSGKKRHPTVENNVTIYANATILGGDTVIGEGSVIGGNTFITSSVPKNSRVSLNVPEPKIRNSREGDKH